MKQTVRIFFAFALTVCYLLPAMGQNFPGAQEIREWYLEERFLITDSNDDALLDKTELAKFSDEFGYYLLEDHFNASDANKDSYLSYKEIRNRVHSEMMYRASAERRELRRLQQSFRFPRNPSIDFFMQRPELVKDLFGNLTWMNANSSTVSSLLSKESWVQQNADVMVVLQRNLRWMVSYPKEAEKLYNNRTATELLPELLGWRADHRNFIRQNQIIDQAYLIDFLRRD